MTPHELLLVLIHEILDDQETTDVVDQSVLHGGVELDSIRILAVVADRVIHLDQRLLTLGGNGLLHSGNVARRLAALFLPKNVGLEVLLSVHISSICALTRF